MEGITLQRELPVMTQLSRLGCFLSTALLFCGGKNKPRRAIQSWTWPLPYQKELFHVSLLYRRCNGLLGCAPVVALPCSLTQNSLPLCSPLYLTQHRRTGVWCEIHRGNLTSLSFYFLFRPDRWGRVYDYSCWAMRGICGPVTPTISSVFISSLIPRCLCTRVCRKSGFDLAAGEAEALLGFLSGKKLKPQKVLSQGFPCRWQWGVGQLPLPSGVVGLEQWNLLLSEPVPKCRGGISWLVKKQPGNVLIAGAVCVAMSVFLPLRTGMKIFKCFSSTCPAVQPLCAVLV